MSYEPDDTVGPAEATERQPRTVSKAAFGCLSWTLFFLILLTELVVTTVLMRRWGVRRDGGWIGGLGMLNLVLAKVAADSILKLMGLSRSGKTVEARGRTVVYPDGEIDDDEVVEVHCPSSFITGLGAACLIFCLVIVLILVAIPHDRMEGVGWAYVLVGVFGLSAGYCFYERSWGTPQVRADSSGITGLPIGFQFRRRFIPWSDVATCEIETYFDTFGKPFIIRPILKGWDGKPLIVLCLQFTKMEDQVRLVKYIKAKLPKPKDDFWE